MPLLIGTDVRVTSVLGKVFLITLLLTTACGKRKEMKLIIESRQSLEVPAASGMGIHDGNLYIIGDNSPWLFKLNEKYQTIDKIQVSSLQNLNNGVIPKANKPDFEALTIISQDEDPQILLFGSGSKSPERDTLVTVTLKDGKAGEVKTFSLENVYSNLRDVAGLQTSGLNIEAAATGDGYLYLFNRGENMLFRYNLEDFMSSLNGSSTSPEPEIYKINLPKLDGIEAGFSGADMTANEDFIIFTASVENTSNWIDDGPILGSFVGIIRLSELQNEYKPECVLISEDKHPLQVKVESVAIRGLKATNQYQLLLVTDSDGGESELIEATLTLD